MNDIYLRHILHGQIEPKSFWLNESQYWSIDEAGYSPAEQFNLILEEISKEDYIKYLLLHSGYEIIKLLSKTHGAAYISAVYTECPNDIKMDIVFENGNKVNDISLAEISGQGFEILIKRGNDEC